MPLLDVTDLAVRYADDEGEVRAVDGVSLSVERGETVGLVGESGSGKTTVGRAIPGLLDPAGEITAGEITFDGRDLTALPEADLRDLRWTEIAAVPQEAMSALNPAYTVGEQIAEAIRHHEPATGADAAAERAAALLDRMDVAPGRVDEYPHQLSGGERQRAVLAMALACDPALIVADEPTTGLDPIVQDRVLAELRAADAALLLVTHDVSVAAQTCDRVGVLYGGKLMEVGPTDAVLGAPANPYTMGLKNAVPDGSGDRLVSIPGSPPDLRAPPDGCRFRERCPFATATCETEHPPLYRVDEGHQSACFHLDRVEELRAAATEAETWR